MNIRNGSRTRTLNPRIFATTVVVSGVLACATEAPGPAAGSQEVVIPEADGPDITPPELRLALGPLVARATMPAGWPGAFDARLDAAINRMTAEVAAGSYSHITDSGDADNPHYGPLRMVTMRNIRAGLPLNESEPGFGAALRMTREFLRQYAAPNGNRIALYRNTNLIDAEIIYWLYKDDAGDNGLLAQQARQFIQVTSAWLSEQLRPVRENLDHHWMDSRTLALAIEAALSAQRIGLDFDERAPAEYNPHHQVQYKPAGVDSWETWIEYINGFIDRMQQATVDRFGTRIDPNGYPILPGNLRWGAAGWLCQTPPCRNFKEPYPFKPFMEAMVANALIRAFHQQGSASSRENAVELAGGIRQHYDPARRTLPYVSHATANGRRFYGDDTDFVLNNFWVKPLLELYHVTGEAWMRQIAVDLLSQSLNTSWTWRFKQSQQLGSATEPQAAQALLAGVHY